MDAASSTRSAVKGHLLPRQGLFVHPSTGPSSTELSSSRCIPSHGLRLRRSQTSPVPYGGHWRGRGAAPQSDRLRVRFGAELRPASPGWVLLPYIICLPYANGSAFRRRRQLRPTSNGTDSRATMSISSISTRASRHYWYRACITTKPTRRLVEGWK